MENFILRFRFERIFDGDDFVRWCFVLREFFIDDDGGNSILGEEIEMALEDVGLTRNMLLSAVSTSRRRRNIVDIIIRGYFLRDTNIEIVNKLCNCSLNLKKY